MTATIGSVDTVGPPNFRDVGGKPTVGGQRLRKGMLFRSSDLGTASPAEIRSIADLGLRSAIDLRSSFEAELIGLPDVQALGVRLVPIQILDGSLARSISRGDFTLAETYARIAFDGYADVSRAVAALAEPDALPAVVFCSAGKDRTGLVVAILLAALGVSREAILDDYAASASTTRLTVSRLLAKVSPAERPEVAEEMLAAPPAALSGVLDQIDQRFGDARHYLRAGGVSAETLARLDLTLVERRDEPRA